MDEHRQDIVLLALVLSVATHAALMFFMRPQVMTHVASSASRYRPRPPMTVREAEPPPSPVAMDSVRDTKAAVEPPAAEPEDVLPAAEGFAMPDEAPAAVAPELPALDSPTYPKMTSDLAPLLSEPIHVEPGLASFTTPLAADSPSLYAPATAAPAHAPLAAEEMRVPVPEIDTPAVVPEARIDTSAAVSAAEEPPDARPEPDPFVPAKEVMEAVDVKVVESEKAAVRGLLDVKNAKELVDFVGIGASSAQAGEWTYFKVAIAPRPDLKTVPKDVVILMDASGSIANDRLKSCREAAREILRTCMNTGDRFNMVAFRDEFEYAFKTWQNCDAAAYEAAESWMSGLAAHGRTDVFSTIASVLKLPRDPARPLIALVVTDGDANEGVRQTSQILSKFTELNDGLVSVYMYGVKQSANRELIDVLTHGNRGESFIYEGNRKYAGKRIGELSERFRDPVLTDLRVVFTAGSRAETFPGRLKNLYRGEFLEIFGRVPAGVREVAFSLKGLNGDTAYEGFFRVSLSGAAFDKGLPAAWTSERAIDLKLRP